MVAVVSGEVLECELEQRSKEYAMRDSNPQPPDSKSDTLSIAPTALGNVHLETITQQAHPYPATHVYSETTRFTSTSKP